MPVTVSGIDRTIVPIDGGYLLKVLGVFEPDTAHRVHIGITGSSDDPVCYAGQGQGNVALPFTSTELRVFTPRLSLGLLSVFVFQTATTDSDSLLGVLTTVKPDFKSRVFDMRRILPPFWKAGPRSMEQLPPV